MFLTNASVAKPLQLFDDNDDCSLIENCCIKAAKQPWDLSHPPQQTSRGAVVCHVYPADGCSGHRLSAAVRARGYGGEPVGWQCWRRQLIEETRQKVIVFAEGYHGIFHLAEYWLLLGVRLKDVPSEVGSR